MLKKSVKLNLTVFFLLERITLCICKRKQNFFKYFFLQKKPIFFIKIRLYKENRGILYSLDFKIFLRKNRGILKTLFEQYNRFAKMNLCTSILVFLKKFTFDVNHAALSTLK